MKAWYNGQFYCPKYDENEDHFMYDNWYQEEFSFVQMAIARCNQTSRELQGKSPCASEAEIQEYLLSHSLALVTKQKT